MSHAYDVLAIRDGFRQLTIGASRCPNLGACRSACSAMLRDVPPSPDFVGRRYRGLVIVGANPGVANAGIHHVNDARMEALMRRMKESGAEEDFEALHDLLAGSMLHWKQLVNARDRQALGFDIEEIAYINLVKCKTSPGGSDPWKHLGPTITTDCWRTHTARQMEILAPRFVIGLWQPIRGNLERLGYQLRAARFAAYSGQRNLPYWSKLGEVKPLFDAFAAAR